jgi:hypothetical protein
MSYTYSNRQTGFRIVLDGPAHDDICIVTTSHDDPASCAETKVSCGDLLAGHILFANLVLSEIQNESLRLTTRPIIECIARKK